MSQRFLGLSLSGGKSDKACLAVIEHYPDQKRVFLARLFEKIKTEEFISADLKIHELVQQYQDVETLAVDVPLTLPKCITCKLKCPGFEACKEDEMIWMREHFEAILREKKPKKLFTPYTQRCVDAYLNHSLEENFEVHHALGANLAPLTARAHFITRRLSLRMIEVNPLISFYRLGQKLKLNKSQLKVHKHSASGEESRRLFLQALSDSGEIFIYQQDLKSMIENNHAFEAFLCAYVAHLEAHKKTEGRPKGFPKTEAWVVIPK